jgi:hypothetical protein
LKAAPNAIAVRSLLSLIKVPLASRDDNAIPLVTTIEHFSFFFPRKNFSGDLRASDSRET